MDSKPKNRAWVKDAAIIFLAVMLVLTFFSNTIMNRTLVEVATVGVTDGSITAKVRGTGTVVANGLNQISAGRTVEIKAVMVKGGQEVSAGDVLFILGAGESAELEEAEQQLRQLELSYQRAVIGLPSGDYSVQNKQIKAAEEALLDAEKALRLAESYAEPIVNAKNAVDVAQTTINAFEDKLEAARMVLVEAQLNYDSGKPAQPVKPETPVQGEGESDEAFAQRLLEYNAALEAYNTAMLQYGADLSNYDLGEQKKALDEAQKAYDDIYNNPGQDVIIARNEIEKLRARYEALLSSGAAYVDDYRSALAARDAAQTQYDALVNALKAEQESNNKSAALTSLELQELSAQIEKQRQKLKELRGEEGTEIVASVSGRVDSVECTAGQTVTPEQILCSIEVPDMGYSLSFSVTNEQARRLRVGDSTTVNNYYWGREIIATIVSIKTDPKNPQSSKIVEFDLVGDVSAGAELSISIGQKSASYDTIVPNSSIRTDSNGSFVLVIEAKNSPLGNRYIARRVAVEVIASDDVNSAVTGELSYGDFVITTSNGPVASGDQVRMADNGI